MTFGLLRGALDHNCGERKCGKKKARSLRDRASGKYAIPGNYADGFNMLIAADSKPPASPVCPLGVSLSIKPGSNDDNCVLTWSGEIPALAAMFLTASLPKTCVIWSAEIGRFCPVETHDETTSPKPFCWKLCTNPSKPPG